MKKFLLVIVAVLIAAGSVRAETPQEANHCEKNGIKKGLSCQNWLKANPMK
jgi:hypothetical protein